jgi:tetratricopeptide (TPR) repeat protein
MDWVVGSGRVARTYFSEENGRLFQLPLTWYASQGWDFSPGYELTNLRFDRVLPDRCVACHSSYPVAKPWLEGKYTELRPGIGCERCHGPGALHVAERRRGVAPDTAYDPTIVNPARLPIERRLDVCEQCHVHADVELPREGKGNFSFLPSQRLSDYYAFYRKAGSIDVVSHADRLRQSACFLATRRSDRPLECATCHDPHQPAAAGASRNAPCASCHAPAALAAKLAKSSAKADHAAGANCVSCHMPAIRERTVPHGTFTEHWIRVPGREPTADARRATTSTADGPIEAYYERDRTGPEAAVYRGMGEVVHATLINDRAALAAGADALGRALGADSTRADALFLLGVAYQQLGDTARAIVALERTLRADPRRPEALRALAQAQLIAGRAAVADSLYTRALAAQPALSWIRAEYADLLQSRGEMGRAVAAYRTALAEQPQMPVAWFNLGTALAAGPRPAEATAAFREAVHLDPSLGEALSYLVDVRTRNDVVGEVGAVESPLPSLPARDRGPRPVSIAPNRDVDGVGITFVNVPPFGVVQVIRPDGSVLRTLSDGGRGAVSWDLRANGGLVLGGGLYRVRVLGRDRSGRPLPPQSLTFGIVRHHE